MSENGVEVSTFREKVGELLQRIASANFGTSLEAVEERKAIEVAMFDLFAEQVVPLAQRCPPDTTVLVVGLWDILDRFFNQKERHDLASEVLRKGGRLIGLGMEALKKHPGSNTDSALCRQLDDDERL